MSVSIANVLAVRSSIRAHANANAHGEYDAILLESSAKTLAGASAITVECVSHRSGTAIVTANAYAPAESTAHARRFSAIANATVFASKNTLVPNRKFSMRKLASVSAQPSSYV